MVFLAEGGGPGRCEGVEADNAREAQKHADEADRAADGGTLGRGRAGEADDRGRQKQAEDEGGPLQPQRGAIDKLVAKARTTPTTARASSARTSSRAHSTTSAPSLNTKNIDNQSRASLAAPSSRRQPPPAGGGHGGGPGGQARRRRRSRGRLPRCTRRWAPEGPPVRRLRGRHVVPTSAPSTTRTSCTRARTARSMSWRSRTRPTPPRRRPCRPRPNGSRTGPRRTGANPPRAARYEIQTQQGWDRIFDGFQRDKKTGTTPPGTPAQTFADNGLTAASPPGHHPVAADGHERRVERASPTPRSRQPATPAR